MSNLIQSKIPLAVREELSDMDQSKFEELNLGFVELLRGFGFILKEIGECERDYPLTYEFINSLTEKPEKFMDFVIDVSDEYPKGKNMIKALFRLNLLLPDLVRFFEIDAEEKIEVGNKVMRISDELKTAFGRKE
ncbi:MAG: hypothetical protein ACFFDN_33500 [Candidatus Hodarchaeota archaeon]